MSRDHFNFWPSKNVTMPKKAVTMSKIGVTIGFHGVTMPKKGVTMIFSVKALLAAKICPTGAGVPDTRSIVFVFNEVVVIWGGIKEICDGFI